MDPMEHWLYAMLNIPYRWGGDDPMTGFDCSGLAVEFLRAFGAWSLRIDASAIDLYRHFLVRGDVERRELGALAFYGTNQYSVSHVGVLLNPYLMVNEGGGGSSTTTPADASEQNAFAKLRRLDCRNDLIAVIRPQFPQYKELKA